MTSRADIDPLDADREIKLAITRGLGIVITDPDECALREALAEIYLSEGFGGAAVGSRAEAEALVADRLAWLRDQRAEGLR